MKVLEAAHITKIFPGVVALKDMEISFELGKVHCIIGENGAGKSTLIKTLTGVYTPEEGTILVDGKDTKDNRKAFEAIAYVPQELDNFKFMTVAENLFMPFSRSGFKSGIVNNQKLFKSAEPYLKKFQINAKPDELVSNLSVSDQQLLQIAHATIDKNAKIFMLDEPTTSLTLKDTERLFEVIRQLKNDNKAVVFISHKLEEIFEIGDEITVLRNGEKVGFSEIKNITMPEIITMMTGHALDASQTFRPEKKSNEVLLEVKGLTGEKFSNIDFTLHKGEILGFSGLVGAGRSEIMQTIFGFLPACKGTVKLGGHAWKLGNTNYSVNNGLIYIPEERKRQAIFPMLGVKENISMPLLSKLMDKFAVSARKEKALVADVIKSYNIKTPTMNQKIQFLSGGNQQKAIIGRSMSCKPKVLIFDEPTKGIDVGTKAEIYKIMKILAEQEGVGIILISSELEEVLKCSNRIITIYDGKKVAEFNAEETQKAEVINSILGINSKTQRGA